MPLEQILFSDGLNPSQQAILNRILDLCDRLAILILVSGTSELLQLCFIFTRRLNSQHQPPYWFNSGKQIPHDIGLFAQANNCCVLVGLYPLTIGLSPLISGKDCRST